MRIMVLGANGYLGKKIIYYLSDQHYVTGVYRNIPATKGKIKMITADIGDIIKLSWRRNMIGLLIARQFMNMSIPKSMMLLMQI